MVVALLLFLTGLSIILIMLINDFGVRVICLIVPFMLLLALLVALEKDQYKKGQIDCINGEIKYEEVWEMKYRRVDD